MWQTGDNVEGKRAFFSCNTEGVEAIRHAVMVAIIRGSMNVQHESATIAEYTSKVDEQMEDTMRNLVVEGGGKRWLNVSACGPLRLRLALMDFVHGSHKPLGAVDKFDCVCVTQTVVDEDGSELLGVHTQERA